VKIDFFDKIFFIKILNKHLKMTKMILIYKKLDFFSKLIQNKHTHNFVFLTIILISIAPIIMPVSFTKEKELGLLQTLQKKSHMLFPITPQYF